MTDRISKKILVVDDELDVIETVRFRLMQEGYDVETAKNGTEALGTARSFQPDVVLLDVMMPGENGYRVARMLRDDEARGVYPHGLAIVLLTARNLSSEPEREEMFRNFTRADRTIYKPFDLEQVVDEISNLLEGSSAVSLRRAAR